MPIQDGLSVVLVLVAASLAKNNFNFNLYSRRYIKQFLKRCDCYALEELEPKILVMSLESSNLEMICVFIII